MYYFPILAITPLFFTRRRGFAMGIVLAGSSLGGLVLAPVQQYLIEHYGVRWALRVLGIWNFVISIPVSIAIKQHPSLGGRGALWVEPATLAKGTFWFQVSK